MPDEQVGVIIESGPGDWQIVQQDADGLASFDLAGRYSGSADGNVEVRLVSEDTGAPVTRLLDWQAADTSRNGRWSASLRQIPAGGLYRLETRLGGTTGNPRGDMRHYLGAGDIWVIAGQSNASGAGRGPAYDPPELGVHQFRNSERWALAAHPLNESTATRHVANREGGNPGHSPFLQFGRLLKQSLGYPIGLIPTALGGSPLSDWNPGEPGGGVLYHNMLHCIAQAGGKIKGVLWYQGETDGKPTMAPSYGERFASAVEAWRAALDYPTMPVLTVQVNRFHQPHDDGMDRAWTQVREAQRQAPRRIPGVTVVPALDLPLSDLVHTSPAGNLLLGTRLAHAALGAVYGKPLDYCAPDVQGAKLRNGGSVIELTFANVSSSMGIIDAAANCFRVEDARGEAAVSQIVYSFGGKIHLVLERAVAGNAVVHGAYGRNPATVPMDMERAMPMLGFYGVPVE